MASRCEQCGGEVDPLRTSAHIVGARVVSVCPDCSGIQQGDALEPSGALAQCADCGAPIAAVSAMPVVRGARVVQLCAPCRDEPGRAKRASETGLPPTPARTWASARAVLGVAGTALLFVAAPAIATSPAPAFVSPSMLDGGDDSVRMASVAIAVAEPPLRYAELLANDERVLRWQHPLAGDRRLPRSPSRRFGALRDRPDARAECGGGHCGVDLGHLRGEVVHAAADGIVDRIVWTDGELGGRYVRIRHPGGFTTWYMHLDAIHPDLSVGDEIRGSEALGTVGLTGIERSAPHLHFAISQTQGEVEHYLDPEPFLREAEVRPEQAPFPGRS
jgi:murein DD-endopeptidase MepM/ murein hydrolase activator NlpD